MIKHKNLLLIISLLLMTIGLMVTISEHPVDLYADTDDTTALASNWESNHQQVSQGSPFAISPTIAAAPDGKTVLVVYSSAAALNGTQNIYYSFSNNNGQSGSWTKNQQLNNTAATSSQAHVIFDQSNRAHVVWVEDSGSFSRIAYAKSVSSNLNDGFGAVTVFPNIPGAVSGEAETSDPKVVTYGSNIVHVIWAESKSDAEPDPNIYHRQSTTGGEPIDGSDSNKGWGSTYATPNSVTTYPIRHKNPVVAVDDSGNLHVLYEKRVLFLPLDIRELIMYVQGTVNNNGIVAWPVSEDTHTSITSSMSTGTPDFDVVEPDILFSNGRLDTSVTKRYVLPTTPSEKIQYVFYIGCTQSCENEANWSSTQIVDRVSYLDASPYSSTSSITRLGSCVNILFDGKVSTSPQDSERIFLSDSCAGGWGGIAAELTNNDESRSIQPDSASQNGWWNYVVYEDFVGDAENENKQILFVRNSPALYLPIIVKR
jgi:hypothetical protein